MGTAGRRHVRVTLEGTAGNNANRGQKRRQAPCGSALGRPFFTANQHAADGRIDGVEQQGRFELILSNKCREWVGHVFYPLSRAVLRTAAKRPVRSLRVPPTSSHCCSTLGAGPPASLGPAAP